MILQASQVLLNYSYSSMGYTISDFWLYLYLIVNFFAAAIYGIRTFMWYSYAKKDNWINWVVYEDNGNSAALSLFTIVFNGWYVLGIFFYGLCHIF